MKKLETGVYTPRDADRLLRDPEIINEVCNPISNPQGWRPKMTTMARSGQTLPEAFRDDASVLLLQMWVAETVNLPVCEFMAAVKPFATLAVKQVPKGKRPSHVPPGINYTTLDAVADLSPPPQRKAEETRPIVVQEAYMRALTNLFARVLTLTCDKLIAPEATAYRAGKPDPVAATVMPIAKAISGGHRFLVAVDIENCFPSLPWNQIRRALRQLGFSTGFVAKLMVLVRAPLEQRVHGRWTAVKAIAGSPAGLSISSILLNVLLRALDNQISREYRGRVVYERYSDNLYFAAWSKDHLTGAVRFAMRWLKEHGLRLKNVSARQKPQSLIKAVQKERVSVLGIEIDKDGRTYVPEKEVENSVKKVEFYRQRLLFAPNYVGAISRYQEPAGEKNKGIDLRDQDDIDKMIGSTARWIGSYNPEQAQAFLAQATEGYKHPRSPLGVAQERPVYVAALGEVEAPWAEAIIGDDPSGRLDGQTIAGLIQVEDPFGDLSLLMPENNFPLDHEPVGEADEFMSQGRVRSGDDAWVESYVGVSNAGGLFSCEPIRAETGDLHEVLCEEDDGFPGLGESDHGEELEANPRGSSCDDEPSAAPVIGHIGSSPPTGKTGSGGAAAGVSMASSCLLSQKRVVVSLAHRWLRRRRYTVVGLERLQIDDGIRVRREVAVVERQEHAMVAGLKVMLDEIRAAAQAGAKLLVVRLEDVWLPKALIQHDRAVRAVVIGQLVADLHRQAKQLGIVVLIAGPVPISGDVNAVIRKALQRAELSDASERAARDGVIELHAAAEGRP